MMRVLLTALVCVCATGLTLHGRAADAGLVLAPTSVVKNDLGELSGWELSHAYDQSGLSSGYTSGVTDFSTYVAGSPTHASDSNTNVFASADDNTTGDIDFDLGSSFTINQLALWDYDQGGQFNIDEFTIFTSSDSGFSTSTNAGTFNLGAPSGAQSARPIQVFDLTDSTARYVRLRVVSNGGGGNTAVGELAFEASAASTPEPASLMLCGLASLVAGGTSFRRCLRKQQADA